MFRCVNVQASSHPEDTELGSLRFESLSLRTISRNWELFEGKLLVNGLVVVEYGHAEKVINNCFIMTDKELIYYYMYTHKKLVNGV